MVRLLHPQPPTVQVRPRMESLFVKERIRIQFVSFQQAIRCAVKLFVPDFVVTSICAPAGRALGGSNIEVFTCSSEII